MEYQIVSEKILKTETKRVILIYILLCYFIWYPVMQKAKHPQLAASLAEYFRAPSVKNIHCDNFFILQRTRFWQLTKYYLEILFFMRYNNKLYAYSLTDFTLKKLSSYILIWSQIEQYKIYLKRILTTKTPNVCR